MLGIGLLLGVAGASFAVALPLVSRWYPPEHQGLALGIAGAGNSGTVVAALAAPRIAEHIGWHGTFGVALLPVALAWAVFTLLAKEPPRTGTTSSGGLLGLLRERDPRWLCLFYLVTFGGFVGLAAYLPIFFVDRFGLTKVAAGGFAALCAVAGSLLRPVGGALADRIGGTARAHRGARRRRRARRRHGALPALSPTVGADGRHPGPARHGQRRRVPARRLPDASSGSGP